MKDKHPIDVLVGKKLRARRIMLGFNQEYVANLTGITFQQIQKYEKGTNRIGASRLYEFSKILGVNIGYFFSELESIEAPEGERETLELMKAFNAIQSDVVRNRVRALIKSLGDI